MYIEQALKVRHDWWMYLIGLVLMLFGWQFIGVIPLFGVAFWYAGDAKTMMEAAESTFMNLGIDANLFLILMIFSFAMGLLGILFATRFLHGQSVTSLTTSRNKVDWSRIRFSFLLVILFNLLLFFIIYPLDSEGLVWNFKPVPFFILFLISLFLLPLQTSFEEYLFRGYLMQGVGVQTKNKNFLIILLFSLIIFGIVEIIKQFYLFEGVEIALLYFTSYLVLIILFSTKSLQSFHNHPFFLNLHKYFNKKFTPLLITSITFGLLHYFNPEVEKLGDIMMVFYIGTGFLLGIMTLMDEGMELALGFHAANNMIAAILVTTDWSALQTDALFLDTSEPSAGLDILLPILIQYPAFLFILAKKYKWSGWKEKLFGVVKPEQTFENDNSIIT